MPVGGKNGLANHTLQARWEHLRQILPGVCCRSRGVFRFALPARWKIFFHGMSSDILIRLTADSDEGNIQIFNKKIIHYHNDDERVRIRS